MGKNRLIESPLSRYQAVEKRNPFYLEFAVDEIINDEDQLKMNLEWLANRRQAKEDQS